MAYKKRFRSRGRFSRVRRRRTGGRRLQKFIKRTIRKMSEIKYATTATNGLVAFDAFTGVTVRLNPLIPQGSDKDERIGNRVRWKFLQFRMILSVLDGTSGANPLVVRMRIMIIQPRLQPAAGLVTGPNITDIFDNSTNGAQAIVSSIKNTSVRVIMDKTYSLGVLGVASQSQLKAALTVKKKVRINNNVNYLNAGQTLPQDPKDNYYLVMICDTAALNDVLVVYAYTSRISYIDI